jgi:hypothetical protein
VIAFRLAHSNQYFSGVVLSMFSNIQILLRIISESWPLELMTVVTSDYTNCKLTVQCQFIVGV